ncbi:MAG: DNA polymerase IV [Gammaproteobacteria bacterium]|nr:DNA polymerase IV [Gammaproteobacteria bacterium]
MLRKIIHIDMDAFFASVEQRDNPQLREKAVIVGGRPDSRGVVAACSYEARRFGVHSAMPCATAYRICPHAVFVMPRFEVYREVSRQIHELFSEFSDLVEPLSLDEAFLDVTNSSRWLGSATLMAKEIKTRIRMATNLTASAGVSYNKFLAKIASDMDKPDGLYIITPEQGEEFVEKLPVGRFFGVGKVTEAKMHKLGLRTGADIKGWTEDQLVEYFGKAGHFFHRIVRGIDDRPVSNQRQRKSISKETTFATDLTDYDKMMEVLLQLAEQVSGSLQKKQLCAKTLTIKVKYADFSQVTRSLVLPRAEQEIHRIEQQISRLLDRTDAGFRPVRLLGIGVSQLDAQEGGETPDPQQILI